MRQALHRLAGLILVLFLGALWAAPAGAGVTVDIDGATLATWHGSCNPAAIAYLFEDGSIMRPCRDPGGLFHRDHEPIPFRATSTRWRP